MTTVAGKRIAKESRRLPRWRPDWLPEWWHSEHPVFVPLAGFFTGMVFVVLVPGVYGAVLETLLGYERAAQLFWWVLAMFVVPIGLALAPGTRRFGRYMLFGVVATAIVVLGVAAFVLWLLLQKDA